MPLTVLQCVYGEHFCTFTYGRDCFLKDNAVDCPFLRKRDYEIVAVFERDICIIVIVKQFACSRGVGKKVIAIGGSDSASCLFEDFHVFLCEAALTVRRDVEEEDGIAADAALVDVENVVRGPCHLVVVVPVEPSVSYGCVHFSRLIMKPFALIQLLASGKRIFHHVFELRKGVGVFHVWNDIEFGVSGPACLIPAPADVFAPENVGFRGQCADEFLPSLIIIGLSSFLFRMCAVQPDFINRPVFREQFEKLVQVILIVIIDIEPESRLVRERASFDFARYGPERRFAEVAVEAVRALDLVEVGRGEVDAELQPVFPA